MKKRMIRITAISLFSITTLVVGVSSISGVNAVDSKCEKIGQKYGAERGQACNNAVNALNN
jgi:hypothetical protein